MARIYFTLAERVLSRIVLADENDPSSCWLFRGNIDSKGYGCISVRRPGAGRLCNPTRKRIHRILWEWANARKLKRGETLDHMPTCPKCCGNPEHLEPVTRAENSRRMQQRRRDEKRQREHLERLAA